MPDEKQTIPAASFLRDLKLIMLIDESAAAEIQARVHSALLAATSQEQFFTSVLGEDEYANSPEGLDASMVVEDGLAMISVEGVLSRADTWFTRYWGDMSTERLVKLVNRATERTDVSATALLIASPGGAVEGVPEAAQQVYTASQVKPVVGVGLGVVASGAYWIASATQRLFATPSSRWGSIGVVAIHYDISQYEKSLGIKVTEVTSSKYKRAVSMHQPLSAEGRKVLEEEVQAIHELFVGDIIRFRSEVDASKLKAAADGRTWLAEAAKAKGLTDEVSVDAIQQARTWLASSGVSGISKVLSKTSVIVTAPALTVDINPQPNTEEGGIEIMATPTTTPDVLAAERARVARIQSIAPKGMEALALKLVADGVSVEEAAIALLAEAAKAPASAPAATPAATDVAAAALETMRKVSLQDAVRPEATVTGTEAPTEAEVKEQEIGFWNEMFQPEINRVNTLRAGPANEVAGFRQQVQIAMSQALTEHNAKLAQAKR